MHSSLKIILASVSMLAVGAVVWRASSRPDDALPNATVKPASPTRDTKPDNEEAEVGADSDQVEDDDEPLTDEDRLNLGDPNRPGSDPGLRRRKIEKFLDAFKRTEGSQQFRVGGQLLSEAIAVIMDSEGRWEPATPAGSDGKSEPTPEPAQGESIITLDGRAYVISLTEFPEFDECTAPERKRLQGEQRSGPPVMTEELGASVEARVQQALAVLQHFERNR